MNITALRAARRSLVEARDRLADTGLPTDVIEEEIARLDAERHVVQVPCLICRNGVEHELRVDDDAWPLSALCGPCSGAADALVRR